MREIPRKIKNYIKYRDGNKCVYCGSPDDLQIDHFFPIKHTYHTDSRDWITSCGRCNRIKKDHEFKTVKVAMVYIQTIIDCKNEQIHLPIRAAKLPILPKDLCPAEEVAAILLCYMPEQTLCEKT